MVGIILAVNPRTEMTRFSDLAQKLELTIFNILVEEANTGRTNTVEGNIKSIQNRQSNNFKKLLASYIYLLLFCYSVYLLFCLSVILSICYSVYMLFFLSDILSISYSVYLLFCLSVILSICYIVYLLFCLSVYLCMCPTSVVVVPPPVEGEV